MMGVLNNCSSASSVLGSVGREYFRVLALSGLVWGQGKWLGRMKAAWVLPAGEGYVSVWTFQGHEKLEIPTPETFFRARTSGHLVRYMAESSSHIRPHYGEGKPPRGSEHTTSYVLSPFSYVRCTRYW